MFYLDIQRSGWHWTILRISSICWISLSGNLLAIWGLKIILSGHQWHSYITYQSYLVEYVAMFFGAWWMSRQGKYVKEIMVKDRELLSYDLQLLYYVHDLGYMKVFTPGIYCESSCKLIMSMFRMHEGYLYQGFILKAFANWLCPCLGCMKDTYTRELCWMPLQTYYAHV